MQAFIPDSDPDPEHSSTSGGEGIWVDSKGTIYGTEVEQRSVARHLVLRQ